MNTRRQSAVGLVFNWACVVAFVLITVPPHRRGNEFFGWLVNKYGPERYTASIRMVSIVLFVAFCALLIRKLWIDRDRLKQLAVFVPVALVIDRLLISVPVERIHYLQYGVLTWLCFRAIGRAFPAAMLAFAVGAIDEANQYWVLYAGDRIQYMDWNDIALNQCGVLIGLLLFLPRPAVWNPSPPKILAAIAFWVAAAGAFVWFVQPDHFLFRNDPYKASGSFWITNEIKSFHVMNAFEGLVFLGVIAIVCAGYYLPEGSRRSS